MPIRKKRCPNILVSVSSSSWDYLFETSSSYLEEGATQSSRAAWKRDGLVFTFPLFLNGWKTIELTSPSPSTCPFCCCKISELCGVELVNAACIKEMSVTKAPIHTYIHIHEPNTHRCTLKYESNSGLSSFQIPLPYMNSKNWVFIKKNDLY